MRLLQSLFLLCACHHINLILKHILGSSTHTPIFCLQILQFLESHHQAETDLCQDVWTVQIQNQIKTFFRSIPQLHPPGQPMYLASSLTFPFALVMVSQPFFFISQPWMYVLSMACCPLIWLIMVHLGAIQYMSMVES